MVKEHQGVTKLTTARFVITINPNWKLTLLKIKKDITHGIVGYVVKMGPDCYADSNKFEKPWCQEKQWVLIGRYAGARFKLGDESECRIINDDEVIATILDPDDILAV